MVSSTILKSQNLINNPGFESGVAQWSTFWSRDGAGYDSLVTSPVHSGTYALKLVYPNTQDWSFTTGSRFSVTPGQLFDISCWAKTDSVMSGGQAQFSIVLYNSSYTAIDWNYSPCIMDAHTDDYKQYSTRFMVPSDIKYIEPRFMGWDACSLYADDVSLELDSIQSISGDYTIEDSQIKAVLHLPLISMTLTNKATSKTYNTESSPFMSIDSVKSISSSSLFLYGKLLDSRLPQFEMAFSIENKTIKVNLIAYSTIKLDSDIKFPGTIYSNSNDYLIVPRGTGVIMPVANTYPYYEYDAFAWKSTMPFAGVTNLTDGYMVASDDQWDVGFTIGIPAGQSYNSIQLLNKASKGMLGYNRTIYITLVNNGYKEMCQWYRQHAEDLGYVKTLSEKLNDNPNIDKLIGAVDFWAINWDITSSFLDTMKLMGMDKAIWNLNTWMPGLPQMIDSIDSKGFLSSRYDIYTDVYPPTHPEWTGFRTEGYPEDVIVDADSTLHKGWLAYVEDTSFQGYYTCAKTHLNYCMDHLPEDLSLNNYNCRFIDVELASALAECYSPDHPATRQQDAAARNNLLSYIKNNNHLVLGDEEAHDFAFQNVDYGEGTMTMEPEQNAGYDWSTPVYSPAQSYFDNNINPTMRVPLHGLTYHDVHIPTWYTGDGATKVPPGWDNKNLWNILYGTMPLYMPPSRSYWNTNFEKFISGYHLISAVTRNVGYEKMTDHKFITADWNVQSTAFANGWNITVNFNSKPYSWNKMTLAPKGFYASNGQGDEVYKIIDSGDTIDWAFANSRIFFNPHGTETAWNGIRSSGPVFIKDEGDFILVSFIGKQSYIDLNASQFSIAVLGFGNAFDYHTQAPVSLTEMDGGWKRLNKTNGNRFYKVQYTPLAINEPGNIDKLDLRVFPNPVINVLNIKSNQKIKEINIDNLQGETVYRTIDPGLTISVSLSDLSPGLYFCKVILVNGYSETRKVLLKK